MKKITKFILFKFLLGLFIIGLFPLFSFAQQSPGEITDPTSDDYQIVPKCEGNVVSSQGPAKPNLISDKDAKNKEYECGWFDLLNLFKRVMLFLIYLSIGLATLSFAYAGFLYLTAFGEMGKIEKAHSIFSTVIIGLFFVFAGWLIVATILKTMGVDQAFSLINFSKVETISK